MIPKINIQVMGAFVGLKQGENDLLLKDITASDCLNVYHDRMGNITKRNGFSKYISTEIESGYPVLNFSLLAYGAPITRTIIGFTTDKISYWDGSAWEELNSGYSSGHMWRTVLYNEVLYMANGYDKVQKGYYRRQFELDRFGADTTSALWLMWEATGTTVADEGETHTMTLSSADMWNTDEYMFSPASIENDGGTSSYYGTITHHTDISTNGVSKFTWKGWAYARSDGENDLGRICNKEAEFVIGVSNESASKVKLYVILVDSGGNKTITTSSTEIDINTWFYFCVVYDGTQAIADRVKIYIDGSEVSVTGDTVNTTLVGASNNVTILSSFDYTKDWDGYLDSLELMKNTALTAAQVLKDYEGDIWVKDCGVTQPSACTATASASAGNLKGTYRYRATYMRGNLEGSSSPDSNTKTVNLKQMNLSAIATGPGDVTARRLYRTTGTGSDFYFLATIDNNTSSTYTDNISDADLILNDLLDRHGDEPPEGSKYVALHESRVYYANLPDYPHRIYWSDIQNPESCYEYNYVITSGSGKGYEEVTALYAPFEEKVCVFTQDRILFLDVQGPQISDVYLTATNAHLGCCADRTIKNILFRRYYTEENTYRERHHLIYLNKAKRLCAFDGDSTIVISEDAKDYLDTIYDAKIDKCFAVHYVKLHQYILFFPDGNYDYCNKWLVWDYLNNSFIKGSGTSMYFSCGMRVEDDNEIDQMIVGTGYNTSYLYKMYDGNSDDGATIASKWKTDPIDLERRDIKKYWRKVEVITNTAGNYDLTLKLYKDGNNTTTSDKTITLNLSSSGHDYKINTKNIMLKANALTYEFSETSSNSPWTLKGFFTNIQPFVRNKGS